jgi:2,3-bisphosphoglycerate-independent phosphoglycerate mutase
MLNFKNNKFPLVLMVLDGWGLSKEVTGNAIALAKTPNIDSYFKKYANTKINASGEYVGLPKGQPGNSEAGHMNIGAGRLVEQDAVIISKSINNGTFFKNPALLQVAKHVKNNK